MALQALSRRWSRHLYLRIWLAVVAGVALLMLVVGWAWRASVEHNTPQPVPREWVVLNAEGDVSLVSTTGQVRMDVGVTVSAKGAVALSAATGMLVMQWPPRISSIPSVTIGDVSLLLFD